jgi:hypothetical protein
MSETLLAGPLNPSAPHLVCPPAGSLYLLSEEIFQTLTALINMLAIVHVEKQVFRWKFWQLSYGEEKKFIFNDQSR